MVAIARFLTIGWTIGALLFLVSGTAFAHKSNMAVLQIEKMKTSDLAHSYQVRYSFSGLASSQLPRPILPADCTPTTTIRERKTSMTLGLAWSTSCKNSLLGREIDVSQSDIRLEQVIYSLTDTFNHTTNHETLSAISTTERIFNQLPQPIVIHQRDTAIDSDKLTLMTMGMEHMLWGLDHVLFVILLVLIFHYSKNLLLAITGFTLGHSITLMLAVSETLTLPSPPVEALIALSIIFLATEGLNLHQGKTSVLARNPLLVTAVFGLLHGLGFAGAISDINIPEPLFIPALFCFNLGIELAQLAIVTMIYPLSFINRQFAPRIKAIPYRLAGIIAGFWFVERTIAVSF